MGSATSLNQLFRNLCHHSMWKYGILWKFQDQNLMIVGKVASMERHQWICIGEVNSELLLEYPEELGLQVAAGIKTILLLPILPLGLVQLGSLDKISEDLTMVAQLKDLFCAYQSTIDSNSYFELRMGQIDSYMALNRPPEKYSTCLEVNNFIDLKQNQPFMMPDLATLTFDQAMVNEHLLMGSIGLPHPMVQSYDPFTQVGVHQGHGLSTELLDEIRWNEMCSEIFQDRSEEQIMLINKGSFTGRTMESDKSSILHEAVKPIPVVSQGLIYKKPRVFDACDINKANLNFNFVEDVVIDSTTDSRNLDFSVESGQHKLMVQSGILGWNNSTWMQNQSKSIEGSGIISGFKAAVPETIGCSVELCILEKNVGENSAQLAMEELPAVSDDKELESRECVKSRCSSSGRCSDSCITQCRTENVSNSEDSAFDSDKMTSLLWDSEGLTNYLTTCPQKSSVYMPQKNEGHENSICEFSRSCLKESRSSNRQTKNRSAHRPRPRDRQLIQDRIRELRELIPNTSKCSIDALLDQTVKHVMFLQSVPIHADKLSQSTSSKIRVKDSNLEGTQVPENPASSAHEVGNKSMPFPLVVENLDQPDQMLVEMQCRNHGLFLDIAQAIKRLGLTILKGILESRLEELWAHFIIEIPKGFHRMDIVWPLMQLLQLKF
ncbi:transcription factor bHLH155-like isoform X2 [Phalaenopsis equestris]|uniref:transcription factor bHLH155-like isoform X2 n=1 Tax=Phalaenopsis equestris TaxID=78828 RepID=UPI0009E23470|nr:transcription factor bHLH155-like isoform X2 [Phalaenopsis equestris]